MPPANPSFRIAIAILTFSGLFIPALLLVLRAYLEEIAAEHAKSVGDFDSISRTKRVVTGVLVGIISLIIADIIAIFELATTSGVSLPIKAALALVVVGFGGLIWLLLKIRQEYDIKIEVF